MTANTNGSVDEIMNISKIKFFDDEESAKRKDYLGMNNIFVNKLDIF